jgi:pyruvate,water dikinase
MEPAVPRWSERPDYLLDLVRASLGRPPPPAEGDRARRREALEIACRARLGPLRRTVFGRLLAATRRAAQVREGIKSQGTRLEGALWLAALEIGRRRAAQGALAQPEDVFLTQVEELRSLARGEPVPGLAQRIARRQADARRDAALTPPPVVIGRWEPEAAPPAAVQVLRGLPASAGVVEGPARVLARPDGEEQVLPGEILVAPFTDPGWTPCFLNAAALVTDIGGLLSHGCIIAREYGLPAVVNTGVATRCLRTGQRLHVDGGRGEVRVLDEVPV